MDLNKELLRSLLVMADVIEARDTYTGGHLWRVAQLAKLIAVKHGLSNEDAVHVSMGGYLHDIGKVGIPDLILRKPDKLEDVEFETIKTHPLIGGNLLRDHPLGELVLDVVLHHHERLDGKGYPHKLEGDQISLSAQIICLADAFDAMTSSRPYRKGMKINDALDILTKASGAQFNPDLVQALNSLNRGSILPHIVGHSDEGIPLIDCPACGAIFTVTRHTHDGDIAFCRTCTGKHVMHQKMATFEAEFTGTTGAPNDLVPLPDMDVISLFIKEIPAALDVNKKI